MNQGPPELGDLLIRVGMITEAQLRAALNEQSRTHERLGEILCRRGDLHRADLMDALGRQLGLRRFDPALDAVESPALELVSLEFARRHNVLPVRLQADALVVATSDPLNVEALDQLEQLARRSGRRVSLLLALPETLEKARETHYGRVEGSRTVSRLIDQVVDEIRGSTGFEDEPDAAEAERRAQDAGIINLVNQIIDRAVQEQATDIHIEPLEHGLVIRYRLDGLLYNALTPPRAVYTGVICRLKILANMDIAERRAPQDGRFTHRAGGREVDIRVSSLPAIFGEKLVLRLLDKSNFSFSLQDLGFSESDCQTLTRCIRRPYGLILLSGPTGSGKSTTLYSSLLELRDETLNITTVEDPVEYRIERINQIQVNERKRVNFSTALRHILRQDPDVIMVGEIRDQDTADLVVRSALTGHMVFSTIHANDAPTTATRLLSMGVEPHMAASALTLVVAQRLVRRNCRLCLAEYQPVDEVLLAMEANGLSENAPPRYLHGKGCAACKGRGYLGRIAVPEMMPVTPTLRRLIAENRPAGEIRELARGEGMKSLRQGGMNKVYEGITTLEEVLRICLSDD